MSTNYRFTNEVKTLDVLKAANKLNLLKGREYENAFCLTDGKSYLWFYSNNEDIVDICRYGANFDAEEDILLPLAKELQTAFLSEHDEGFFETEEEDDEKLIDEYL